MTGSSYSWHKPAVFNCSDQSTISCGLPQGSILGSLLFLIYVNDMKGSLDCDLLLYADDLALLVSDTNVKKIEKKTFGKGTW